MRHIANFLGLLKVARCERAATAVEYGLIIALICLMAMVAIRQVATKTINTWGNVANVVSNS